jgi:hypothetical protein
MPEKLVGVVFPDGAVPSSGSVSGLETEFLFNHSIACDRVD